MAGRRLPWYGAAPALLLGVLVALGLVVWWVLRLGSGPAEAPPPAAGADSLTQVEVPVPAPSAPGAPGRGSLIGALAAQVGERLDDGLPTRPITGGIRIAVRDVRWRDGAGEMFATLPTANARLDGGALRAGDIVLRDMDVRGGVVRLVQRGDGGWNYEEAMAGLLEEDGGGGSDGREATVRVAGARLRDVRVEVETLERDFTLRDVDAQAPEVLLARPDLPEPLLRIAELTTVLDVEGMEDTIPVSVSGAEVRVPEGRARFRAERAVVAGALVTDVDGVWNPELGGWGVEATGRAPSLAFQELGGLRPELLPEEGAAAFAWRIQPAGEDRNLVRLTELAATSGASQVAGSVAFVMGPEDVTLRDADLTLDPVQVALLEPFTGPLPYTGTLRGAVTGEEGDIRFDLAAELATAQGAAFAARLEGALAMGEDGAGLRRLVAEGQDIPLAALAPYVPGLSLTGTLSGKVALTGPPTAAPLDVDVRFELASGVATAVGTVDLTGAVPTYDVEGRLLGVEMNQLLQPELPPVALTARYTLVGSGTDLATLTARFTVDGRWTGWQSTAGDTVAVAATVEDGAVRVAGLDVELATLALTAEGTWRFVEPVSGAIAYDLSVADMAPFGPWVPAIGDVDATGSLAASGSLSGPLAALRAEGEVEGRDLAVGGWSLASVDASYQGVLRDSLPEGEVALTFADLATPTAGAYTAGTLELSSRAPDFSVALEAERVGGGGVQVVADGRFPAAGPRDLVLQEGVLAVRDERWVLTAPAGVRWGGVPGIQVDSLEVTNVEGTGRLYVDGTVWPPGEGPARLELAAIPVGEVQQLFGIRPRLAGLLSGSADVRGPPASPEVDAAFDVVEGEVGGVPFRTLEGTVRYAAGRLEGMAAAALDTAGAVRLEIALPAEMTLGASPSFRVADAGTLEGSLTADSVALRPLGELAPQVTAVTGRVTGTVALGGTVGAPSFDGDLRLANGGLTILELNQRFTNGRGRVVFEGRTATVDSLVVESGGPAVVAGTVRFEEITEPVLDLTVAMRGFRPLGVDDQDDAALEGQVRLAGPLDAPVLTGRVAVGDGTVAVPRFGGGLDDLDIYAPPVRTTGGEQNAGPSLMDALQVRDLVVVVEDDAWFQLEEARAQLSGQLTVNRRGDDFGITGSLEGTRGTYVLQAGPIVRQFELVRAQIRFLGSPEPNPALDITARRSIIDPSARQFDVTVRVGGTLRNPTLGLASADAPSLPESELLSYLLFGQPSFAVEGTGLPGEQLLTETYLGGLTELASVEIGRGLADQLDLDLLTLRVAGTGPAGFGDATLVLGRELDEDLFLTVESTLGGLFAPSDAALNTWAARLEWAFDPRSRLRLGVEPVYRGRLIRGLGAALPNDRAQQQFILEVRRRWTY